MTLLNRLQQIAFYVTCDIGQFFLISNARVEATNNKIKLTIRMAYGFRNIDNLIALIYLRCGGRVIYLPGRAPVKVT